MPASICSVVLSRSTVGDRRGAAAAFALAATARKHNSEACG